MHVGSLLIYDEGGNRLASHHGVEHSAFMTAWFEITVQLNPRQHLVVFEGVRGGRVEDDDRGDICIDDVRVWRGSCGNCMLKNCFPLILITALI